MSEDEGEEVIGRGSGEADVVEMLWQRVAPERRAAVGWEKLSA